MIRTRLQGDTPFFPNMLNNGNVEVCLKEDVDAVIEAKDKEIAELKAAIDKEKAWSKTLNEGGVMMSQEIERLKAALESEKASRYAESVDAGMRERRLKRALYKACAMWAKYKKWDAFTPDKDWKKWHEMSKKCRAKAEGYK